MSNDERREMVQRIYDRCLLVASSSSTKPEDRLSWLKSAMICDKILINTPADTLHQSILNMKTIADLINFPTEDRSIDELMAQADSIEREGMQDAKGG